LQPLTHGKLFILKSLLTKFSKLNVDIYQPNYKHYISILIVNIIKITSEIKFILHLKKECFTTECQYKAK